MAVIILLAFASNVRTFEEVSFCWLGCTLDFTGFRVPGISIYESCAIFWGLVAGRPKVRNSVAAPLYYTFGYRCLNWPPFFPEMIRQVGGRGLSVLFFEP